MHYRYRINSVASRWRIYIVRQPVHLQNVTLAD